MDAKNEEKYWREHHEKQTSVKPGHTYEHYAPAYKTGYEGFHKHPDKKFEEIEADLAVDTKNTRLFCHGMMAGLRHVLPGTE